MNAPLAVERKRWFGLYPALVADLVDPDGRGRIKVRFPGFGEAGAEVFAWATLLTPYADQDQGLQILPEVDSQVVIAFEAGDPMRPYIVGACWNGQATLPQNAEAANNKRTLKTRSGSQLEFDDTEGAARITLSMQSGHQLVLDDAAQEVTFTHSNGCILKMNAAGQVTLNANVSVDVTAPLINLKSPMVKADSVVQCSTLIANSVVSSSYTPGAGNIW
ncbi:hypothetical protein SAMN04488038_10145 [Solimonas aquatica]|uniref:Gp5/Type VI secretion system Vgr protein OB-fold domain-containing protein n=1 Tax=Solimonas aquatica TaxID=489703 RepID=A0A1H8ZI92_9GAMM|nr:phage baseplate assembly protein V [Solimonas aquatica]SEP63957.1 hypothetical protein SAMN04488038_10145 [Solimonas aquatica]